MHKGVRGSERLQVAAQEAAHAYNERPGASGFSPAIRLFRTRARAYGEICKNGEHIVWHPDALDGGNEIVEQLQLRRVAQQAAERTSHVELVAKSVAAQSCRAVHFGTGQLVFF